MVLEHNLIFDLVKFMGIPTNKNKTCMVCVE